MASKTEGEESAREQEMPALPESEGDIEDWKAMLAGAQEKFEAEVGKVKMELVDLKQNLVAQKLEIKEEREKGEKKQKEEREKVDQKKTEEKDLKDAVDAIMLELEILNFPKTSTES